MAGFPLDFEVALLDAVLNPVVAHVNGLKSLESDCVVGDAVGNGVVCDHRGGLLRVTEICESVAGGDSCLAVNE